MKQFPLNEVENISGSKIYKPLLIFVGLGLLFPSAVIFALHSMLNLAELAAVVGILLFLATNKTVRTLSKVAFSTLTNKLTHKLVKQNPIEVLREKVYTMKKHQEALLEQMVKLSATSHRLKDYIYNTEKSVQENLERILAIKEILVKGGEEKKLSLSLDIQNKIRQNEQYSASINNFKASLQRIDSLYDFLTRFSAVSQTKIDETANNLQILEMQHETTKSANLAMRQAMSTLKLNPEEEKIFDMANAEIKNDIFNNSGEIDQLQRQALQIVDGFDLENSISCIQAMKKLETLETKLLN